MTTSGGAPAKEGAARRRALTGLRSVGRGLRGPEGLEVVHRVVDLQGVDRTGEGEVTSLGDLRGQDRRVGHRGRDLGQRAVAVRALVAVARRARGAGQEPLLRRGAVLLLPGVRRAV